MHGTTNIKKEETLFMFCTGFSERFAGH